MLCRGFWVDSVSRIFDANCSNSARVHACAIRSGAPKSGQDGPDGVWHATAAAAADDATADAAADVATTAADAWRNESLTSICLSFFPPPPPPVGFKGNLSLLERCSFIFARDLKQMEAYSRRESQQVQLR